MLILLYLTLETVHILDTGLVLLLSINIIFSFQRYALEKKNIFSRFSSLRLFPVHINGELNMSYTA